MNLKQLLLILVVFISLTKLNAQITIDNTTYTPTQLIDGVLVPAASGTTISNVVLGGVYGVSSRYQVGYFSTATTTLAQMGFSSGVVLSTGNTSDIPLTLGVDPRSVGQMSRNYISCTAGEIRQGGTCPAGINDVDVLAGAQNYFNASILEFDFVPVENSVVFRYIFGSEEYSDDSGIINYQCSTYNDKFGFLISGPGISGGSGYTNNARNIARLTNGSEVSINSVNSGVVGSSGGAPNAANCTAANGENNGAITVNQTKEEKDSKQPTVYLGNHKIVWMEVEDGDNGLPQRAAAPKAPQAYKPDPSEIDDLPF